MAIAFGVGPCMLGFTTQHVLQAAGFADVQGLAPRLIYTIQLGGSCSLKIKKREPVADAGLWFILVATGISESERGQ